MDISTKIKELRVSHGYTLEAMATKLHVSKQGYHLWEQGLRAWSLDILTRLSEILAFNLIIADGVMRIGEPSELEYTKIEVNMQSKINLLTHKIVKLYTGSANVNFEEQSLLEEWLVITSEQDAAEVFGSDNLVPVYALFDFETGDICPDTCGLDMSSAYTMYYRHFAPTLDLANTVYHDALRGIRVAKGFASFDIEHSNADGTYNINGLYQKEVDGAIPVFITTNIEGERVPQLDYVTQHFPINLLK